MRHIWMVAAMLAIGPAVCALAQDGSLQGDPGRGKVLAYTCTGCHGIPFYNNVYPTYTVPRLGGQNQQYMIDALKGYRAGEREHATMQAQAATLSDQDILDVTAYFASLSKDES